MHRSLLFGVCVILSLQLITEGGSVPVRETFDAREEDDSPAVRKGGVPLSRGSSSSTEEDGGKCKYGATGDQADEFKSKDCGKKKEQDDLTWLIILLSVLGGVAVLSVVVVVVVIIMKPCKPRVDSCGSGDTSPPTQHKQFDEVMSQSSRRTSSVSLPPSYTSTDPQGNQTFAPRHNGAPPPPAYLDKVPV